MKTMWHFCGADRKLSKGDGRHIKTGRTLKYKDDLWMCKSGLHASPTIYDALQYAPGPILCKVVLGGKVIKGDDKSVAEERTVLKMRDVTNDLHEFACQCAERALRRVKVTDSRCWDAIKAKRLWLRGKISDKELAMARDAAGAADTAGAAWDVARDAAWDASGAVAGSGAWAAEIAWQKKTLQKLCG